MNGPRFHSALIAQLRRVDPDLTYHPPSYHGGGDDFVELSPTAGGGYLPNPARAAEWLDANHTAADLDPRVVRPIDPSRPRADNDEQPRFQLIKGGAFTPADPTRFSR